MRQLVSIAVATFREAVRNKILYSILFFAVALIALSIALGSASLNQDVPVITSIGLTAIHFFSDLIAIFIGVTMVFQELERKTIYNVLSKPVSRHSYFFGKFAGMALTLLVQLAIMSAVLAAVLAVGGGEVDARYLAAVLLTWVESLVVLSFALFFSSFSTPYVSGFLALGVWLVGGLTQNLTLYIPSIEDASARQLARSVVAVLPDFSLFDLTTQLMYAYPVTLGYVAQTVAYGASLGGVFLVAGAEIFRRRDFI
ncbi:MAG: ABC transporter permease subunit [Myxococcales bacterium]|nr:ABC transporter permease subunit [Myxococcales bacterium]MCB9521656.1 ABC transporter permease subunit [Myxococcales bacterium]MCB9533761.1 ABC transporter permease subunit [Myxococcales bacterium]